jgi:hypothetical protein
VMPLYLQPSQDSAVPVSAAREQQVPCRA